MKNATTIDLGGMSYEIQLMSVMLGGKQMLVVFYDERNLSEIAADFEGRKQIVKTSDRKPGVKEVYEGYEKLVSIARSADDDMVRVMLARA